MIPARTIAVVLLLASAAMGGAARAEPPAADLLQLHTEEAEGYRICRDRACTKVLKLRTQPITTGGGAARPCVSPTRT